MVESGVDEGLEGATWPPVPVKHQFAVSEALPLHRLGLVPPPPEIGPHLLTASPLEAALAAALATAELQAIPVPAVVSVPVPAVVSEENATEAAPDHASDLGTIPPVTSEAPWLDVALMTDVDHAVALGADETVQIAPQLDAVASATLTAPPSVPPETPAHGKLLRLDLSRRGAAPPANEMPLPPPPDSEHSSTSTVGEPSPATLQPAAGVRPDPLGSPSSEARLPMPPNDPPAGNWPGFLTGFVMAVAIGVGLYVSLVGS